jgi:site-specific recombinase XerD
LQQLIIQNSKHKALLTLTYSTGIRVSEVINLLISDIDSKRMIIFIRNAKGNKDRIVPLSEKCCNCCEFTSWNTNKEYLFNGQFTNQYSETSLQSVGKSTFHNTTCIYATFKCHRFLEAGTDLRYIQKHWAIKM